MTKNLISKISIFLSSIIYILFFYFVNKYNILPKKLRFIILGLILLAIIGFTFLIFKKKNANKVVKAIFIVGLVLISVCEGLFMSYANKSITTVEKINQKNDLNKTQMSFVALKDSNINSINDIKETQVAIARKMDEKNIDQTLEKYKKENEEINAKDFGDYLKAGEALINQNAQVMLLNESFRQMLDESIEGFSDKTKVLKSYSVKGNEKLKENNKVEKDQSFNVYISGIDTYGALSNVSRSDVNLIVSVNPKKGKILITTIPRDTYVNLAGLGENANDKLTHAGLFGVDTSIKTLENFLDVDIDYYAKVNFTTLVELINELGGITVDNPVAFDSTHGNYHFPQGKVEMDGDMALSFSRERYNLAQGDFDRGKNHTRVLIGIIKKILSPDMLLNFNSISDIVLKSVNTNVSYNKMIELVNEQLDSETKWKIKTQALTGTGSMDLNSYLMPNANLYMMIPNEDSVKEVHEKIENNNK